MCVKQVDTVWVSGAQRQMLGADVEALIVFSDSSCQCVTSCLACEEDVDPLFTVDLQ